MATGKTVLVTGSNAGIGLEAARQLAGKPEWRRIILGARSEAKAQAARDTVVASTGRAADDFGSLVLDLVEPDSVRAALADVERRDLRFDAVVLNAGGMVPAGAEGMPKAESGLSTLFAMNVGGHAQLVHGLLAAGRIVEGGTVVFPGSEASRGIPMMRAAAPSLPDGYASLDDALWAVATGAHVSTGINDMYEYGLVKLMGIAWMRELAHRRGSTLRAVSMSPGMTAGTNATDGMPKLMKLAMDWIGMPMMKLVGTAHSVERGAARYMVALENPALANGGFYASPGTGLTGKPTLQSAEAQPLLEDDAFTRAVGRLIDRVA